MAIDNFETLHSKAKENGTKLSKKWPKKLISQVKKVHKSNKKEVANKQIQMIRLGIIVEGVEKLMPHHMVFKPQKELKKQSFLTTFVEHCQFANERSNPNEVVACSRSNSADIISRRSQSSLMDEFEVKSEENAFQKKSVSQFPLEFQKYEEIKSSLPSSLRKVQTQWPKGKNQTTDDDKSSRSKSSYSYALSNRDVMSARIKKTTGRKREIKTTSSVSSRGHLVNEYKIIRPLG